MNKKELLETILKDKQFADWSNRQGERFLNTLISTVITSVKKGDDVSLVGFGTFTKAKRAARIGVNPSTGEKIKIKAKTVPKFRPGQEFRDAVK
ncbi:MAG: HU family DNA-binding protein [Oligoflexia bacterium]|nr:HU family DNA-binding protein [Oligoflexia bacterium]MBF0365752.1 HU family DNA-binding protein [Oligoflexia bacterium]